MFNKEDNSFIEYYSNDSDELHGIVKTSKNVSQYSKFTNAHYDLVSRVEERVTKHGHPISSAEYVDAKDMDFITEIEQQFEGINTL